EESIDVILDAKAENPDAVLVVAGCLPLRYREGLAEPLPEVDVFVSPDAISDLPVLIGKAIQRGRSPRSRPAQRAQAAHCRVLTTPGYAYLKIAEGCSRRCGYCTIPSIRGPLRSVPLEALEDEARCLAEAGAREIVLVAQDLTAYGRDQGENDALLSLLERLHHMDAIQWIRLMYLHPAGIPAGLASLINESDRVLPYLDIPFQHVSDRILRAMRRPGNGDRIRKLVDRLRREVRGLVLRTTFMVGFPGEGDREFEELREFVATYDIERVGVFTYSPEEGTPASRLGDPVPQAVKNARADELRRIHNRLAHRRSREKIGTRRQCLVEGVSSETDLLLQGRTWEQAPEVDGVLYITAGNAVAGEIRTVKITDASEHDLFGELVERGEKDPQR
ncbi:MAG: 30S ribosomal protein S12 methylthiotransferase RimO, partial [Desulfomonile sp.]|nr:30S ribosomal protein S12 methylthiotransferase RimO [Desulfomonile sp.]